jgi:hypothetical protein
VTATSLQPEAPGASPDGVPARRYAALRDPRNAVLAVVVLAYVVARLVILDKAPRPFRSYDSAGYAPRGSDLKPSGTLSLIGDAPRPWGVPLLYAFADGDRGRVVLQWGVATIAWAALAVALWLALRGLVARAVAAGGVLGLALIGPTYIWDYAILSESLSISLGIATMAALLIWVRTRWWLALAATVGAAVWWLFTRQDLLPLVGVLTVVLALAAWRLRDQRRRAAVAAGILVVAMAWMLAIIPSVDARFALWSATGETQTGETFLYRLHALVLRDPVLREAYVQDLGMPTCPAAERASVPGQRFVIQDFTAAYYSCPDLVKWGERNKLSSYRLVVADPGAYLRTLDTSLPRALGGGPFTSYAKPIKLLPLSVQRTVYPPSDRQFATLGIALAVVLAAVVGTAAYRRRTLLVVAAAGLVVCSVGSILFGLMHSAGEFARFGIQEAVFIRVAVIVLAAAAIDAFTEQLAQWRSRRLTEPKA